MINKIIFCRTRVFQNGESVKKDSVHTILSTLYVCFYFFHFNQSQLIIYAFFLA